MHSAVLLLQTLLNWGPGWLWLHANPRGKEIPVNVERGMTQYMASNIKGERSPPSTRQRVYVSLGRKRHAWAADARLVQVPLLTRQQEPGAISLKSFTMGDIKKGDTCESHSPSQKPHHSVPAECMIFTKKMQPQPCKKDKILNELKSDNILAFQMSLLIFPPFRTAKSLHGCF